MKLKDKKAQAMLSIFATICGLVLPFVMGPETAGLPLWLLLLLAEVAGKSLDLLHILGLARLDSDSYFFLLFFLLYNGAPG